MDGNNSKTDHELYREYIAGKNKSYDALMVRYGDSLTSYLYGFLNDWQDAEDLMIEAFARIMVKRPAIRDNGFKAYLYKTARNLAARFHSKKDRTIGFCLDDIVEEAAAGVLLEDEVCSRENSHKLHECLSRLVPELREVLWLIFFENMSYADAAKVMGVNTKRIDHLLTRGKKNLKSELEKEGFADAYERRTNLGHA